MCSYGYGGSVSHAVIEEFPNSPATRGDAAQKAQKPEQVILVLSASQEKRLAPQATALADWLSSGGKDEDLAAIAATLALRRAAHKYRAAFVVSSHDQAVASLRAFSEGGNAEWTADGRAFDSSTSTDAVWVFSGHGAQWTEMGSQLLKMPVFMQALTPLDDIVKKELGYSAIEALQAGNLGGSDRIQVLTYLVQVSVGCLLFQLRN